MSSRVHRPVYVIEVVETSRWYGRPLSVNCCSANPGQTKPCLKHDNVFPESAAWAASFDGFGASGAGVTGFDFVVVVAAVVVVSIVVGTAR